MKEFSKSLLALTCLMYYYVKQWDNNLCHDMRSIDFYLMIKRMGTEGGNKMPTALVTGAAGFVGGHLIDHLAENGIEVCVTKLEGEAFHNNAVQRVYDLDINKIDNIKAVLDSVKPHYVFHLAAQSSVSRSWQYPAETIAVNTVGTINLLEAIKSLDMKARVLLIGSGEEYGYIDHDEIPISETSSLRPGNIYAVSKVAQGMIGQVYSRAFGMEIIIARAFNHIGPGQSPNFVVAGFAKQIAEIEKGIREAVIKTGNLDAKRDFTDVRDVVKGYYRLLQDGQAGQCYNIASGKAVGIHDVLNKLLSMSKVKVDITTDAEKMRPSDVPIIEADISKIKNDVGWQPQIGLEQSLSDTLRYWRECVHAI